MAGRPKLLGFETPFLPSHSTVYPPGEQTTHCLHVVNWSSIILIFQLIIDSLADYAKQNRIDLTKTSFAMKNSLFFVVRHWC